MKKIIFILIISAMLYGSFVVAAEYRTSTATQATFGTLYCSDHTAHSIYSAAGWTAAPTAEYTLVTCTIRGGDLGTNGKFVSESAWSGSISSNNKTIKAKFGGIGIQAGVLTTTPNGFTTVRFMNKSISSQQIVPLGATANSSLISPFTFAGANYNPLTISVDTSKDQSFVYTGQTTTEAGVQTTSLSGDGSTCTAVKASHGYNAGEYLQVSSGSNCATSGNPNANPVQIISAVTNTFTYACSCSGAESGTQPTAYRYSVIQLEAYDVEIKKP